MDFCQKKMTELQRQSDQKTEEIKFCMTKGQRDKAKLLLKRKKIIEKQMEAVQNVRALLFSCAAHARKHDQPRQLCSAAARRAAQRAGAPGLGLASALAGAGGRMLRGGATQAVGSVSTAAWRTERAARTLRTTPRA